jgi:DNA-binding CsgD family transcriptional regulator
MGRRPTHKKPPFVGVGGKVEDRVEEAKYPWITLREEFKHLREEGGSSFTFLEGALYEEQYWRTQLRAFGIDGRNVFNCRAIEGAQQAQTDKERSARNYAYGCLKAWQPTASVGMALVFGEWVLYRVVTEARRQPVSDISDWLLGSPELSIKLFDVLADTLVEAMAESQGYVLADIPKEREGEQANYLLAGLLRTRLRVGGQVGCSLSRALTVLAGEDSDHARKTQLLRELPGATRVAWSERGSGEGIAHLRNRVGRFIAYNGVEESWRENTRRSDPEQVHSVSQKLDLVPEHSPEELPEAHLFETDAAEQLDEIERHAKLSPQQKAVLQRVRRDMDTVEIANELGISNNQVYVQKRNAISKLKLASKAAGF